MMRYSQNKYRGLSYRRKISQILFFSVLGTAILLSFLMLGNLLHDRLDKAAPLLDLPAVSYADTSALEVVFAPPVVSSLLPKESPDGVYCTVDDTVLTSGDASRLQQACAVAAELYDGISVTVSDENGLRFAFADDASAVPQPLTDLMKAAKNHGLVFSAVWQLPDEVPGTDSVTCTVASALARAGADEILFTGLSSASLSDEELTAMSALYDAVRAESSSVKIGFALMPEVFADVDSAPRLETLSAHTDILAVDFGEPAADDPDGTAHALESAAGLYGSIGYYPLRILIRGGAEKAAAQSAALQQAGYTSIQPLS